MGNTQLVQPDAVVARDDDALGWGPLFVRHRSTESRCQGSAPVTHSFAALVYAVRGAAIFEQRGRYTLEEGDMLLVPAGAPHRVLRDGLQERWELGVALPFTAPLGPSSPFERVRSGASAVVRIPTSRHEFVATLFRELEAASVRQDPGAPGAQQSLLRLVLDEVSRAAAPFESGTPPSLAAECLRVIEARCLEPLTLEELAHAVHRSPSHVTTALRRATGRTAHGWIVAGRMAEARRRLLHSDEHVEIVAERVGYGDATHFIRTFRKLHGATPAAWRRERAKS
jgi:AraC family transcriptional regulator, transcriptional activator of pobA